MLDRLFLLLVATAVGIPALATGKASSCPCVQITPQRLPDLNIPREGHAVFCAGGELMVAGGHTNGFVTVDSFDDHRIAMMLSIAGLTAEGETEILNSDCVKISFANFYEVLKKICK